MLPLRLAGEGSREESGAGPHPVGFADSTSPVSRERCPQRHRFALRGWPVESIVRADLPMRLETSAGARIILEPNLVPLPNTRLFARFLPVLLLSAACAAASPAVAARSLSARAATPSGFEPAASLEGNY